MHRVQQNSQKSGWSIEAQCPPVALTLPLNNRDFGTSALAAQRKWHRTIHLQEGHRKKVIQRQEVSRTGRLYFNPPRELNIPIMIRSPPNWRPAGKSSVVLLLTAHHSLRSDLLAGFRANQCFADFRGDRARNRFNARSVLGASA
jgi:hypothetical protein